MNFENEQDCMRVCYQHWEKSENDPVSSEQLSIITYAVFLEIINKQYSNGVNADYYIDKAKEVYQHGLENGWMKTH